MDKNYTYEITKNGYYIFIDGIKVIHQYEPYLLDSTKDYEANAKAQIIQMREADTLEKNNENKIEQLEEQITELQLAMIEISEAKEG